MDDEAIQRLKGRGSKMFGKPRKRIRGAGAKRPRVTPKNELEGQTKKDCINYMKSLGMPCNRQQSGKVRVGEHHMHLADPGSADLVSVMPDGTGRILEIECKRLKGGIQSDDQKDRQVHIESVGGVYVLANTVDALKCGILLNSRKII